MYKLEYLLEQLMTYEEMCARLRKGEPALLLAREKWERQLNFIERQLPRRLWKVEDQTKILNLPLGSISCALCYQYYKCNADEHCYDSIITERYLTVWSKCAADGHCSDCPITERCSTVWGEFLYYLKAYLHGGSMPFTQYKDKEEEDEAAVRVDDLLNKGRKVIELIEDAIVNNRSKGEDMGKFHCASCGVEINKEEPVYKLKQGYLIDGEFTQTNEDLGYLCQNCANVDDGD